MKKLKARWGIKSNFQVFLIFIVFGINGSLAVRIAGPLLDAMGVYREDMNGVLYWVIRILVVFPIYQVTLIIVGALFGQFRFFWNMEKKMLQRMGFKRFFKS